MKCPSCNGRRVRECPTNEKSDTTAYRCTKPECLSIFWTDEIQTVPRVVGSPFASSMRPPSKPAPKRKAPVKKGVPSRYHPSARFKP